MTDHTAEALEPSEETSVVEPEAQEPESAETAPADDAVADTTEAPEKKPSRRDKRIDQLTGEKYALKEDRDYWRNKALAQPEQPEAPEPKVEPPTRPKLGDFDHDIDAYADALADFTQKSIDFAKVEAVTEITETAEAATAKQSQDTLQQQRHTRFGEKQTKFAEDNSDYYDIAHNTSLNISETMTDVIYELENGPGVIYHLGMHPEIADRIARKSPVAAAIELGKIEQSLANPTAPGSTTTSSAPDPLNPISTSRGKAIKDPSKMPMKDYAKHYYARFHKG